MKVFLAMTSRPWPFTVILPAILIAIAAVGWTRDDYIEDRVENLWIPTRSEFHSDKEYAEGVDKLANKVSNFAAMAIARDGGNLFTESRLNEIRDRMEQMEGATIEYKGVTYTWQDLCLSNNVGLGTKYKFPCLRLTMMDLFKEAQWYFDEQGKVTWYNDLIQKLLVKPRVARFGVMTSVCTNFVTTPLTKSDACNEKFLLRTVPEFAVGNGYSADYANPIMLLSDVGNFEMNDPCKICIEDEFESLMQQLTQATVGVFQLLLFELNRLEQSGTITNSTQVQDLQQMMMQLSQVEVDRAAVEEWYHYFVVRGLYAQLGASSYVESYAGFMQLLLLPCQVSGLESCPTEVTPEEARAHLLNHADNAFSHVNTAGAPFPFWSEPDGTGYLFGGTFPFGGSGVDMSGALLGSTQYLDLENFGTSDWAPLYGGQYIDPFSATFETLVEGDPVYKWFVAGVTPMSSNCGNGNLTGTNFDPDPFNINPQTAVGLAASSQLWCTKHNVPFEEPGERTQQFFAKMFYDLLVDSPSFLAVTQGENDPYDWTNGNGCDYDLRGSRYSYSDELTADILSNASRILYNFDEGASIGALDRNFLMGGSDPPVGEYSFDNPLKTVPVIQSVYPALDSVNVMERLTNCNRPGGPVTVSEADAEEILKRFKEEMELKWVEGWDDENAGEVQFVGFFDDQGGAIGTTGRVLNDLTLDNGTLTGISIGLIAVFSVAFLFSFNLIESRAGITLVGVSLVILSFFSSLALGILFGIKINVNIAWTLPFIILGLGVDDMYIILLALKERKDYSEASFVSAMTDVIVPVTMTSLVNFTVFAFMNLVDIPTIYLTAQVAMIAVVFLYLTVVTCFPAFCYLDMKRQEAGRYDILICRKTKEPVEKPPVKESFVYHFLYRQLLFSDGCLNTIRRIAVLLGGFAIIGVGVYGITERHIGFGLQDFFPSWHQAHTWALETSETLGSWSVAPRWADEDYGDPDTQLYIMRQFERIIETPHIAESNTKSLWLASFNMWMTRHCTNNFGRDDPDVLECGMDQVFPGDNTTCSGFWMPNTYGAREKAFSDGEQCFEFEGGVCRPTSQMHEADLEDLGADPALEESWCPVFEGFSNEKLQFCLMKWHNFTGGGGDLIRDDSTRTPYESCDGDFYNDAVIDTPVLYSAGPNMFSFGLFEHEDYLDMIRETRAVCDDDPRIRCWMTGIPFNYWEQYLTIERTLLEACGAAVAAGFGVSWIFLFFKLMSEKAHSTGKIIAGSFLGAALIASTTLISLVGVIGISSLIDVTVTAFSTMSFLLSVGFVVEYSVHIVHRFMEAPISLDSPVERVQYAMSFLALPTFMAFISSTIGVACLAFTEFEFNDRYFFRPLMTVMLVTYFFGCWFLPAFLSYLNLNALKCGATEESQRAKDISEGERAKQAPVEEAPAMEESLQPEKDGVAVPEQAVGDEAHDSMLDDIEMDA